ncbi:hypothetical protein AB0C89_32010, partial [Streptomyces sp. NPDC048491]
MPHAAAHEHHRAAARAERRKRRARRHDVRVNEQLFRESWELTADSWVAKLTQRQAVQRLRQDETSSYEESGLGST